MTKVQLNTRIPEELYNRVIAKTESDNLTKPQIVIDALLYYLDNNDNTEPIQSHTESHSNTITLDNIETYQEQIRILEEKHKLELSEKEERIKILQDIRQDLKDQVSTKDMQFDKLQHTQQAIVNKFESKPMLVSGNGGRWDGLKYFLFGNK